MAETIMPVYFDESDPRDVARANLTYFAFQDDMAAIKEEFDGGIGGRAAQQSRQEFDYEGRGGNE